MWLVVCPGRQDLRRPWAAEAGPSGARSIIGGVPVISVDLERRTGRRFSASIRLTSTSSSTSSPASTHANVRSHLRPPPLCFHSPVPPTTSEVTAAAQEGSAHIGGPAGCVAAGVRAPDRRHRDEC